MATVREVMDHLGRCPAGSECRVVSPDGHEFRVRAVASWQLTGGRTVTGLLAGKRIPPPGWADLMLHDRASTDA